MVTPFYFGFWILDLPDCVIQNPKSKIVLLGLDRSHNDQLLRSALVEERADGVWVVLDAEETRGPGAVRPNVVFRQLRTRRIDVFRKPRAHRFRRRGVLS